VFVYQTLLGIVIGLSRSVSVVILSQNKKLCGTLHKKESGPRSNTSLDHAGGIREINPFSHVKERYDRCVYFEICNTSGQRVQ
jgi:hypothetical protein